MIAITHIQNTEPNPPIQIADETPTIFPVPTRDAVETISAWKEEKTEAVMEDRLTILKRHFIIARWQLFSALQWF